MRVVLQLLLLTVLTSGAYIKRSPETQEHHREKRAAYCNTRSMKISVGDVRLLNSCEMKITCQGRQSVHYEYFRCPVNTVCIRNRCKCKPGTVLTRTSAKGRVEHCENIDYCNPDPCQNGATCEDQVNNYTCHCPPGFTDRNCSTVKKCQVNGEVLQEGEYKLSDDCSQMHQCMALGVVNTSNNNCEEHSSCHEGHCKCDKGTKVVNTTHDGLVEKCKVIKCKVMGKVLQFGDFKLNSLCSVKYVCEDSSGIAKYNYFKCPANSACKGHKCKCKPGTVLTRTSKNGLVEYCENIDDCNPDPCLNGATCEDRMNGYTCHCPAGFTDTHCSTDIDDCNPDPCLNGATCQDQVNGYICHCPAGFTDTHCSTDIDDCNPDPCLNGATCRDQVNGYTCHCPAGFTDTNCSTDIDDCNPDPCLNGATCQDQVNGYTCRCPAGFTDTNCSTDIDDCNPDPCLNGATCRDQVNGYTCHCPAGFTDTNCSTDIDDCNPDPCLNGATCQDQVNNYTCHCPAGFTDTHCSTDIDDCNPDPCLNGATCLDQVNGYTCRCPAGFTDTNCSTDIDDCNPDPCLNGATCQDQVNNYTCHCPAGFTDTHCSTDIDDCNPDPCLNGATCLDQVNGYTCRCPAGFTDTNCSTDIDDCNPDPCLNGATCQDQVNNYTCHCPAGFTDTHCSTDIDDCNPDPCLNGATCQDQVNNYTCHCPAGFTDTNCSTDIDDCNPDPCLNEATCQDQVNNYICHCPAGFTDTHCSTDIDDCSPDPCRNGATCEDQVNGYTCRCPAGFTDTNCSTVIKCKVNGELLEEGEYKLSDDCSQMHQCMALGVVNTNNYSCQEHSSCYDGRCRCYEGTKVVNTTHDGLVEKCEVITCKVNGEVLEEGHYKLSDDCSQIHQCMPLGSVSTSNYRCPEHASCHEGRCKCDEGTKLLNTAHDGFVEKCEVKPMSDEQCRVGNKTLEPDEVYISHDCSVVHGCFHGEVTSIGFSCTDNTFCAGGKCVCKEGYEVTSTDYCGSLQICELETCKVGFLILQEGDAKLNKDCTTMYTCSNGVGAETDNSCPDNSSCQDFQCVCDPGTELHSTTHGGLVEHCERQPVK